MITITNKIPRLLELGILQLGEQTPSCTTYLYKNTPILQKNEYGGLLAILQNYPEETTQSIFDYIRTTYYSWQYPSILVEWLWQKEVVKPTLFFKNGNVRITFINDLISRISRNGKLLYKAPTTLEMISKIEKNWTKLPENIKYRLRSFFDDEGICTCYNPVITVITISGTTEIKRASLHKYRETNLPLPTEYFVKKDSPIVSTEIVAGNSYELTEEEMQYLARIFSKCTSCNSWEKPQDLLFGLCEKCTGEFPDTLDEYSSKATDKFDAVYSKSKYSPTLMGVELEYELTGKRKEALFLLHTHLKTHAIFKRDGSLLNGIEICTRPASINIHLEQFSKVFQDTLLKERIEVRSSCGMHVHIDRRSMSALSLGKLINFMQAKNNTSFLQTIAGREGNRYSVLGTDLSITSYHRQLANTSRYLGINTQNKDTAEIRIFKTPTTFSEFVKNMEFVSALVSFVHPAESGIKDLTDKHFINFVRKNKSIYKELHKFITEKGYYV